MIETDKTSQADKMLDGIVALELQAGLDGLLAIEKCIRHQRGLFDSDRRREPNSWSLDRETREEGDRLLQIPAGVLASESLAAPERST